MFYEISHKNLGYTHTAHLENGVTLTCYEDGTAEGNDGRKYCVVTHLDEDEDVVVDGWEPIEKICKRVTNANEYNRKIALDER